MSNFSRKIIPVLLLFSLFFHCFEAVAQTFDIRAKSTLQSGGQDLLYVLFIADCSLVAEIKAGTAGALNSYSRSDTVLREDAPLACELTFTASGDQRLAPTAVISYTNGSAPITVAESFEVEQNPPTIEFDSIAIINSGGEQHLVAKVRAGDNVDISYVTFNLVGLEASVLRKYEGVIDSAMAEALVSTGGQQRIYPTQENQREFALDLKMSKNLTAEQILHDGIAILDAHVYDASGNGQHLSKIAFTGQDVQELVLGLTVEPKELIITDQRQTPMLMPTIEYQFRGKVTQPGNYPGITFTSSKPDFVTVTPEGVVIPLKEPPDHTAAITVSYPGVSPATVNVKLDFTATLSAIKLEGIDDAHPNLKLGSLGTPTPLPKLLGVFRRSDGSEPIVAPLSEYFNWQAEVVADSAGLLNINSNRQLIALKAIDASAPAHIQLTLPEMTGVPPLVVPVMAEDAPPAVKIMVPEQTEVGSQLEIMAEVTDDVAVAGVEFFLNDRPIGSFTAPPFKLNLVLTEEYANQTVRVSAKARDSAGHSATSASSELRVSYLRSVAAVTLNFATPLDGDRIAENTNLPVACTYFLGKISSTISRSPISRIDYLLDGDKVATAYAPNIEIRKEDGNNNAYESWNTSFKVPVISTQEAGRSILAVAYDNSGHKIGESSRFFKIRKNSAPNVRILAPTTDSDVAVEQNVKVDVEITDDTLMLGTTLKLLVNDLMVQQFTHVDRDSDAQVSSFDLKTKVVSLTLPIKSSWLGSSLRLQAEAIDYHGSATRSDTVRLTVKADAPPTVALAYPVEGTQIVAGTAVEIRAEAADDVGIDRVDFYVNDQLVGSDNVAPYAFLYQTPTLSGEAQPLTFAAVALDIKGHSATSNKVKATLGKDLAPPSISLSSPALKQMIGGKPGAEVIEKTTFVLKAGGIDNVGVKRILVQGIKKGAEGLLLTGMSGDQLTESDIALDKVPGALGAWSAMLLVKAPPFSATPNLDTDVYVVKIKVFDLSDNSSELEALIGIRGNNPPVVKEVIANKSSYFARDWLELSVLAEDELSVDEVKAEFYQVTDGNATPVATLFKNSSNGLIPSKILQTTLQLNLATLTLANSSASSIRVQITAKDALGNSSQAYTHEFPLAEDNTGPKIAIFEPDPVDTLYQGSETTFKWRAVDNCCLGSILFKVGSQTLSTLDASGKQQEGIFTFTPGSSDTLTIDAVAHDYYGNGTTTPFTFKLAANQPPLITLRSPAAGSRVKEGEALNINVTVTDDRAIELVKFFAKSGSAVISEQKLEKTDIAAAVAAGRYLGATLRVPTIGTDGSLPQMEVTAIDSNGASTTLLLPLNYYHDDELPKVSLSAPTRVETKLVGENLTLEGIASDDIFIGEIKPILIENNASGAQRTIELDWSSFSFEEKTEVTTVPNPISFGSIIEKNRYIKSFKGSARLAADKIGDPSDKKYQIKVHASDNGVNSSDSNAIGVTIIRDIKPPVVAIYKPEETVYDRQPIMIDFSATDNSPISSYKVYVVDDEGGTQNTTLLKQESGLLNSGRLAMKLETADLGSFSLSRYLPVTPEGKTFSLVVEATDSAGNTATGSRLVKILPDSAPDLSLITRGPDLKARAGGVDFVVLERKDDYFSPGDGALVLATSLSGLAPHNTRQPRGEKSGSDGRPFITLAYPEAQSAASQIKINSTTYYDFTAGTMRVYPLSGLNLTKLEILGSKPLTITYDIERLVAEGCAGGSLRDSVTVTGPLDLTSYLTSDTTQLTLTPHFTGEGAPSYIKQLRFNLKNLKNMRSVTIGENSYPLQIDGNVTLIVDDKGEGTDRQAFVEAWDQPQISPLTSKLAAPVLLPAHADITSYQLVAYATDHLSSSRTERPLTPFGLTAIEKDIDLPVLTLTDPASGSSAAPHQNLLFTAKLSDSSQTLHSIRILDERQNILKEIGGIFFAESYSLNYELPSSLNQSVANFTIEATDPSGNKQVKNVSLPLRPNEAPQLVVKSFMQDKTGTTYASQITAPERINYGEFWLRPGQSFALLAELSDDTGLKNYRLLRIEENGARTELVNHEYPAQQCPPLPTLLDSNAMVEQVFTQNRPTQYQWVVEDNNGTTTTRNFVIHPVSNIMPMVQIFTPASHQKIVAGTTEIKVGVAVTDDRELPAGAVEFTVNGYAEGVTTLLNLSSTADKASIDEAFLKIYDRLEALYNGSIAAQYGWSQSPHAAIHYYSISVPEGVIKGSEPVTLTARVTDSDGSKNSHELTFESVSDTILPELMVLAPEASWQPVESNDFTFEFNAYDNVKVKSIKMFQSYKGRRAGGVDTTSEQLIEEIKDIPQRDFNPVTTLNIDTPVYKRLIHLIRSDEIINQLGGNGYEELMMFLRAEVTDSAGNQNSALFAYTIKTDEKPTIDIEKPKPGDKLVEGSPLFINVIDHDDVGLQYVHLTATYQDGRPPYEMELKAPPYQFVVNMPAYNHTDPSKNVVDLRFEAIDTYGYAYNAADHRVIKTVAVEVVQDSAPTVAIAAPPPQSEILEGARLLVQVAATDDVNIERVALQVRGLKEGDRTYTDIEYPFEFAVPIPYGQSGQDLQLTASATEIRYGAAARTVTTPVATVVHVAKDSSAPVVEVIKPAAGNAVVVENRTLPVELRVLDNVAVTSVELALYADLNGDNSFTEDERQESTVMTAGPFVNSFALRSIANYLAQSASKPEELAMSLRIIASDGVGNKTTREMPLTLKRNTPPVVNQLLVLNSRGESLGNLAEISEGREIVIVVNSNDAEAGVDLVALYQAEGVSPAVGIYKLLGKDGAAPIQIHYKVPVGAVGSTLNFRAVATDVDGYSSALAASPVLSLKVVPDRPPTVAIVKPANDNAAYIEGQTVEVFAQAYDDFGPGGIDRVIFYVNNRPYRTVHQGVSGPIPGYASDQIFKVDIFTGIGIEGLTVQAIAYDIFGHSSQSNVVHIGKVEDTVAPEVSLLYPLDGEILTAAETLRPVVAVRDIGSALDRKVFVQLIREYQNSAGSWVTLDATPAIPSREALAALDPNDPTTPWPIELKMDDNRPAGDLTPQSQPEQYSYVYWADLSPGAVLQRQNHPNERVRMITKVYTPRHEVEKTSLHEVGYNISERRYLIPLQDSEGGAGANALNAAKQVFYTAIDQYHSMTRTGAMVGAWSNINPLGMEQGLGYAAVGPGIPPRTGIFMLDAGDETARNQQGEVYIYSPLWNGAAEIFSGTIGDIKATPQLILASKSGYTGLFENTEPDSFPTLLEAEIIKDWENPATRVKGSGTGNFYYDHSSGELLIFGTENGEGQFGAAMLLQGRIDLPFNDVYGLDLKDNLAFVANGHGGVQVIDVHNVAAPYRLGFIKPDGLARDVKIHGSYAYIAASEEGVAVVDLTQASLPIVAKIDTMGIANRLHIVGDKLYVANMVASGGSADLNVIDIQAPRAPKMERTVTLAPKRRDLTSKGVYNVYMAGNLAYLTTGAVGQDKRPAQNVLEIVDLTKLSDPKLDPSTPVMIDRRPSEDNFLARGMVFSRGAIHVAAGRKGIDRIDLSEMMVLQHAPYGDETEVNTALDEIHLELSAEVEAGINLTEYLRVYEREPSMGVDITDAFTIDFVTRSDGSAIRNQVRLSKNSDILAPNVDYHVVVKAGLRPVTGYPMAQNYSFKFYTSAAGDTVPPEIFTICAKDAPATSVNGVMSCPSTGPMAGGTHVILTGHNFGESPKVIFGNRQLTVTSYTKAAPGVPNDQLEVVTVPDGPGPVAVTVVGNKGLKDTVIGGFTFTDMLLLSHADPAVIRMSQTGAGSRVNLYGQGFTRSLTIKAYKSGTSISSQTDRVDGDRVVLVSGEKLNWQAPVFEADYRGFIDIELLDEATGHRYFKPRALFAGGMSVVRTLVTENNLTQSQIDTLTASLSAASRSSYLNSFIPDALKLPPGKIVGLASEPEIGLLYVLGKGFIDYPRPGVNDVQSLDELYRYYAPGWISLVQYQRDALHNAAPMHGLGYFNLPQDLVPTSIYVGSNQVYVLAKGYQFAKIDTESKGTTQLLVYDKIKCIPDLTAGAAGKRCLPGEDEALSATKDRSILYTLPLNISGLPTSMIGRDRLLFTSTPDEGVFVISIADPLRPFITRKITKGMLNGRSFTFGQDGVQVAGIHISGSILHVMTNRQQTLLFDFSKADLPQVGSYTSEPALVAPMTGQPLLALSNIENPQLTLLDLTHADAPLTQKRFDGFNFASAYESRALSSLATTVTELGTLGSDPSPTVMLPLYDLADRERISLLDLYQGKSRGPALPYAYSDTDHVPVKESLLFAKDGVIFFTEPDGEGTAPVDQLNIIDSGLVDLVDSTPSYGQRGFPIDQPLYLEFSAEVKLSLFDSFTDYIGLRRMNGSAASEYVAIDITKEGQNPRRLRITPTVPLDPSSSYRVEIKGVAGSRRTLGLFDFSLPFETGRSGGAAIRIAEIVTKYVPTAGGEATIILKNAVDPAIYINDNFAPILTAEEVPNVGTRYVVRAPAASAGSAAFKVTGSNGSSDTLIGALAYFDPLMITAIEPAQGSINGGDKVIIRGAGFRSGTDAMQVLFGERMVSAHQIKVLDFETMEVMTPPGLLGKVDITLIATATDERKTLTEAFTYIQPIQTVIGSSTASLRTMIYDLALDPTGNYAIAAAGEAGVVIFNINGSSYTGRAENPLNADALRGMIDEDGDRRDDRILTRVQLPGGFRAMGVAPYFENGEDRIFVTGVNIATHEAKLFILAFDSSDITKSMVMKSLQLPTSLARRIIVVNSRAQIAMGEGGLGVADTYLQNKLYLAQHFKLPGQKTALDLALLPVRSGAASRYVVVGGKYDIDTNRLIEKPSVGSGGFYVVEQSAQSGFKLRASLDIPAMGVVYDKGFAYLACGEMGIVIVDLRDPATPKIVSRLNTVGYVYDVDIRANMLYVARGSSSILTVDVTNPAKPTPGLGAERLGSGSLETIVASQYGTVAAGQDGTGGTVQVAADAVLKIHTALPEQPFLSFNSDNQLVVRLLFNKDIATSLNQNKFKVTGKDGIPLPVTVTLNANEAKIQLSSEVKPVTGDELHVVALAGIQSSAASINGAALYRLGTDQSFSWTLSTRAILPVIVESVVPHRIARGSAHAITIGAKGIAWD
jgi:hypothetical protein